VDIILYSIPFFFLLIGLELVVQWRTGRGLHRLYDSVADLSCGVLSQLSGIFTKLLTVAIYIWVGNRFALQVWLPEVPSWPEGAFVTAWGGWLGFQVRLPELVSWATVFVLVDLAYYWSHRLSHEVNVLWAGHVVHHSSEEYNLAVALRQSSLHGLFTWIFYLPLALVGVPWLMFAACYSVNLVYQFWIHTRAVGRMGRWTELVMNTPSHHRVHHGVNPKYQDRNYAGVFIVWDRAFGSFQPEEEEPVYGITHPLRSWNPLWANVHVFWQILRDALAAGTWRERWMYVFGPPGWRPESAGGPIRPPEVSRETFERWDTPVPGSLAAYGFVQFLVALAGAVLLLVQAGSMPLAHLGAGAFYVTVALAGIAGVFEAARWAGPIELARLLVLGGVALTLGLMGDLAPSVAAAAALFCVDGPPTLAAPTGAL
jgi:sterol desaturase/sphingolipid hydroxylase (fatty acid hydroxylase superfamily)